MKNKSTVFIYLSYCNIYNSMSGHRIGRCSKNKLKNSECGIPLLFLTEITGKISEQCSLSFLLLEYKLQKGKNLYSIGETDKELKQYLAVVGAQVNIY